MLIKEIYEELEHRSDHLVLEMLLLGWICNVREWEYAVCRGCRFFWWL